MHEDDEGRLGWCDGEPKEESNLNWDHQGTRWINLMEMNLCKTNSIAELDTPKHDLVMMRTQSTEGRYCPSVHSPEENWSVQI